MLMLCDGDRIIYLNGEWMRKSNPSENPIAVLGAGHRREALAHSSVRMTTNEPFAAWGEVFPNVACVVSLIDRLMHRAGVVRVERKSYRQKEAARKVERAAR